MSKKFTAKKITNSHTTVIDAAVSIVQIAEKCEFVEKISLGIIRQCRTGRGHQNIKYSEIPVGLEIVVRGNSYVQTIYLFLHNPGLEREKTIKVLSK